MAKRATPQTRAVKTSEPEPVKPPARSAYVVFARRFRPSSFSDVVGQNATTGALQQALSSGRLAQAYLFCGPRGVGKTSLARIIAKALNCLQGKGPGGSAEEPCNQCEACTAIQDGSALDVIEMDAATNRGIEEIRSLRENVGLAPAVLRYKVYIIDEVHMLTKEAWNAFLKTLEEPPAHVKFIFATTDPNNVPETILSRCQRYDLRRIGLTDIIKRLRQICELEKVEFEEMALSRIANLAKGGLRDAEGLLDQAVNLGKGNVTDGVVRELSGAAPDELIFELLTFCAQGKPREALLKTHEALEAGADPEDLLTELTERVRGNMLARVCGGNSALLEGQMHLKDSYARLGEILNEEQSLMLLQLFTTARRQMKDAAQTRLPLEMALIRAARAGDLVDLGKLVSTLESGASATPAMRANPPNAHAATPANSTYAEGSRPNSEGRLGASAKPPQAANQNTVGSQTTGIPQQPASGMAQASMPIPRQPVHSAAFTTGRVDTIAPETWTKVIEAARPKKGGAFLASAVTHASAIVLDTATNVLRLGFAAEQLFYRDAMEKPHNQATLQTVLTEVFGRSFGLLIERVNSKPNTDPVPSVSIPPAPLAKVITPEKNNSQQIDTVPEIPVSVPVPTSDSEPGADPDQIEHEFDGYDGMDELPLNSPAPAIVSATGGAPKRSVPDSTPPAVAGVLERSTPLRKSLDPKSIASHPLVQLVLKEAGGVIISATQR